MHLDMKKNFGRHMHMHMDMPLSCFFTILLDRRYWIETLKIVINSKTFMYIILIKQNYKYINKYLINLAILSHNRNNNSKQRDDNPNPACKQTNSKIPRHQIRSLILQRQRNIVINNFAKPIKTKCLIKVQQKWLFNTKNKNTNL